MKFFLTVTLPSFMKYSPCFQSLNITKNAETHPLLMRDLIIEQSPEYKPIPIGDNKLSVELYANNCLLFDWAIDLHNFH